MKNQNVIEWLESTINEMINHGADLGEDLPALMKHIESAKEKYSKDIEGLNNNWANSREQTRHFAERIGFRKGIIAGVHNYEDYWNTIAELQSGDSFVDETETQDEFIDKMWNEINHE
jgi:hypothetical protein